jgi:GH25 family lysozyme M1 (1,4-beta-N-acetylmuramidase)
MIGWMRSLKYWLGAKKNKLLRGAYHYYRPNENSLEQAELLLKLFLKEIYLQF